jgi:hypothetical protein
MEYYLKSVLIKRVDGSRSFARTIRRYHDSGYPTFRANSPTNEELDDPYRLRKASEYLRMTAAPRITLRQSSRNAFYERRNWDQNGTKKCFAWNQMLNFEAAEEKNFRCRTRRAYRKRHATA